MFYIIAYNQAVMHKLAQVPPLEARCGRLLSAPAVSQPGSGTAFIHFQPSQATVLCCAVIARFHPYQPDQHYPDHQLYLVLV